MFRRLYFPLVVFLLLLPSLISAQTPASVTVDFTGAIQSTSGTVIVINGQIVDISAAQMGGMLLAPGVTVRVVASVNANGSLSAQQIELVPVAIAPGLVELNGIASEITATSLRLGSQMIDLSGAQVVGSPAAGQPIQVIARASGANAWTARVVIATTGVNPPPPPPPPDAAAPIATPEILPPAPTLDPAAVEVPPPVTTPEVLPPVSTPEVSDDFRVEGRLEAVGSSAVMVDGQRYDISSARIDDPLSVGAFVRMEVRTVDGQFVVERIRVEDDDD